MKAPARKPFPSLSCICAEGFFPPLLPSGGIKYEKKGLSTSALDFYFLNFTDFFSRSLSSAYSLSSPYFPDKKL